jgi:hypothetical protein
VGWGHTDWQLWPHYACDAVGGRDRLVLVKSRMQTEQLSGASRPFGDIRAASKRSFARLDGSLVVPPKFISFVSTHPDFQRCVDSRTQIVVEFKSW